ncbi:MAG: hypothetical protein HYU33_01180 [Candidatus Omnitrophica bacterium]|nr:hypothetical protein [Candidatus Omnitrophota bacterium]
MGRCFGLTLWILIIPTTLVCAGSIETAFLERPWPKEQVRQVEVGRYEVRWRQKIDRKEGLFTGARFEAPMDRQKMWEATGQYSQIGSMTPGVTAVRIIEDSPGRQVIQVDVKVLWKSLRLTFEIEREPPEIIRFRLVNKLLGQYTGVCTFKELAPSATQRLKTQVDLSTHLLPSRPMPLGLLAIVERMTLLQAIQKFLEACEK